MRLTKGQTQFWVQGTRRIASAIYGNTGPLPSVLPQKRAPACPSASRPPPLKNKALGGIET